MDLNRFSTSTRDALREREPRLRRFLTSNRPGFLVVQRPSAKIWGTCNSIEEIYQNNIAYMQDCLQLNWTDDLPYMEPWIGTGVYANAFGCPYCFRNDNAPQVRYRYQKIEELCSVDYPDYRQSPIMKMVLDCIDCLRERTRDRLPIALTDTQSPFDTATLVLDAAEFFVACYTHPEIVTRFLQQITDLIAEFSRVQMERIGPTLLVQPGHTMPSIVGGAGISVSDDNLAVSSPQVNRRFALPMNAQLAALFDGLAIHSCGVWAHTMAMLSDFPKITAIECAVGHGPHDSEPTPNSPVAVRNAIVDSSIVVKARLAADIEQAVAALHDLAAPHLHSSWRSATAPNMPNGTIGDYEEA